ncbi:uncharacterized protein LOC105435266 isoform X2 [Cucumis sativus]|uniref:uncharacterized protein LOC105435266 isoform X2 n=1 Tax=Cucumis sativus TaxID=3659 RepID=UPI0012F4D126|nr:uncharacterized protein LOC105435266 isoform X2 [Cucumis sativus]KAE8649695.1 hypothetical protein Csa_012021 [Cucumis sativus]
MHIVVCTAWSRTSPRTWPCAYDLGCVGLAIARATPDAFGLCRGMIKLLLGCAGESCKNVFIIVGLILRCDTLLNSISQCPYYAWLELFNFVQELPNYSYSGYGAYSGKGRVSTRA